MPQFMQLPPYSIGNALDTSPLSGAIDQFGNALKDNRKRQQNMAIGNRLAAGDYSGGAALAFGAGELDTGMGIRKFKSAEDAAAEERETKLFHRIGGMVQNIIEDEDKARGATRWQRLVADVPNLGAALKKYGVDPSDTVKASTSALALFRGYQEKPGLTFKETEPGKAIVSITPQGVAKRIYPEGNEPVQPGFKEHKDRVTYETTVRKEFDDEVKSYKQARGFAERLKGLVSNAPNFGSGAGDIATVFSFIKALDPTSTVSPGEQATAQSAPGIGQNLLNMYNKLLTGQFLNETTRNDMVRAIEVEMNTKAGRARDSVTRYQDIVRRSGGDPANVVDPYLFAVPRRAPLPRPASAAPTGAGAFAVPRSATVPQDRLPAQPTPQLPPRAAAPPGSQGQIPPGAVRELQSDPSPDAIREFEEKYRVKADQFLLRR